MFLQNTRGNAPIGYGTQYPPSWQARVWCWTNWKHIRLIF